MTLKTALGEAILKSVEALESAPGNYVAVYKLRSSDACKQEFDRAVIELASEGRLALSDYDGPRPVAEDRAHEYVQDSLGRLYIGLARTLREE